MRWQHSVINDRIVVDVDAAGPELFDVWSAAEDMPADLRWYLEDFLEAPYGVYAERGEQVAAALPGIGEEIFALASRVNPAVLRSGIEVVVRSRDPRRLALPWELMRRPGGSRAIALEGGVSRSLDGPTAPAAVRIGGDGLRVLLVICRPGGRNDVPYRLVARPLVERLAAGNGAVELVVLRPPTLRRLQEVLAEAAHAGRPFHVVHFDGHGRLDAKAGTVLAFEFDDEQVAYAHGVGVTQIAGTLASAGVQVVLLNACQSGMVGPELDAAVATQLLAGGALAVVAMAYSVQTAAAAEFVTALYERLVAGDRLCDAVTAGRRRLAAQPLRPSAASLRPLADWMVPVHYFRQDVVFRRDDGGPARRLGAAPADDGFVGRDDVFYMLERAAREPRPILLHGMVGIGKSAVAEHFARWWTATSGSTVADPVWVTAAGHTESTLLDELAGRLGRRRPDRPMAVVLDGLDALGAEEPSGNAGLRNLAGFLAEVAKTPAVVVVTTRSAEEKRLGDVTTIAVTELQMGDTLALLNQLLPPPDSPLLRLWDDPAFPQLMYRVGNHPALIRALVPRLRDTEPAELLHTFDTGGIAADVSLDTSFRRLSSQARRLLPVLCLLAGVASSAVLAELDARPPMPAVFAGQDDDTWNRVLAEAENAGLLQRIQPSLEYETHPALPSLLARHWQPDPGTTTEAGMAATCLALLHRFAGFGEHLRPLLHGDNAPVTLGIVQRLEPAWRAMLGFAVGTRRWREAAHVVQVLVDYFENTGQSRMALDLARKTRNELECVEGARPEPGTPAAVLWVYLLVEEAGRLTAAADFDAAEALWRLVRDAGEPEVALAGLARIEHARGRTAEAQIRREEAAMYGRQTAGGDDYRRTYEQGRVAERQGNLAYAARLYTQSCRAAMAAGDQRHVAGCTFQMAIIAHRGKHLDDARQLYDSAYEIFVTMFDQPMMAMVRHQQGLLDTDLGDLDGAERHFLHALRIVEARGDANGRAAVYIELGSLAARRNRLDDAERWFQLSAAIERQLGRPAGMARAVHQLGMVAYLRGRFDEAEQHLLSALSMKADPVDVCVTLGALSLVERARGNLAASMEWLVRCVAPFPGFPNPVTGMAPADLADLTNRLGMAALEQTWWRVAGGPVPSDVRAFIYDLIRGER